MTVIIILIVLGILLFVIEFLLVPGVTIAGIGGLILTVFGVYKAFADYENPAVGIWVLIGTIILSVFVIIIIVFKLTGTQVRRIREAEEKHEIAFRELEHSQKLSSVGRLAAGVAQAEGRTPWRGTLFGALAAGGAAASVIRLAHPYAFAGPGFFSLTPND